jgi:hypothetical protein
MFGQNEKGHLMAKKKKRQSNLTEHEQRDSRASARILMIGIGVMALFIVGMGAVMAVFNAAESSAVNDLYGETIASSCQPVPVGSTSTDYLPPTGPPRPLVLLIADSQRRHAWHSDLSTQWRAENESAVVLVGCVEEDYVELETCSYTREAERGGDTFTVRIVREQHTATVTLINPADGRRVDALTLNGPEPSPCPADTGDLSSGRERGPDLTWADFAVWAEGYVLDTP